MNVPTVDQRGQKTLNVRTVTMTDYVDITVTLRVPAHDCKEGIELVEGKLGENDDLCVGWPTIERVQRGEHSNL